MPEQSKSPTGSARSALKLLTLSPAILSHLSSSASGMPIAGSDTHSREISLKGGMTGSTLSPTLSGASIDSIASNVFATKMSLAGVEAGDLLQAAGYQEFQLDKRERGGFQEVLANDLVSNDTGIFVSEGCEVYFGYTPRKAATWLMKANPTEKTIYELFLKQHPTIEKWGDYNVTEVAGEVTVVTIKLRCGDERDRTWVG